MPLRATARSTVVLLACVLACPADPVAARQSAVFSGRFCDCAPAADRLRQAEDRLRAMQGPPNISWRDQQELDLAQRAVQQLRAELERHIGGGAGSGTGTFINSGDREVRYNAQGQIETYVGGKPVAGSARTSPYLSNLKERIDRAERRLKALQDARAKLTPAQPPSQQQIGDAQREAAVAKKTLDECITRCPARTAQMQPGGSGAVANVEDGAEPVAAGPFVAQSPPTQSPNQPPQPPPPPKPGEATADWIMKMLADPEPAPTPAPGQTPARVQQSLTPPPSRGLSDADWDSVLKITAAVKRAQAGGTPPTAEASTHWFFADGGSGAAESFFVLQNPSSSVAPVTVKVLLPNGAPVLRTYRVPGNSRMTVNVREEFPEAQGQAVGAEVKSEVPIVAERAMYWGKARSWLFAEQPPELPGLPGSLPPIRVFTTLDEALFPNPSGIILTLPESASPPSTGPWQFQVQPAPMLDFFNRGNIFVPPPLPSDSIFKPQSFQLRDDDRAELLRHSYEYFANQLSSTPADIASNVHGYLYGPYRGSTTTANNSAFLQDFGEDLAPSVNLKPSLGYGLNPSEYLLDLNLDSGVHAVGPGGTTTISTSGQTPDDAYQLFIVFFVNGEPVLATPIGGGGDVPIPRLISLRDSQPSRTPSASIVATGQSSGEAFKVEMINPSGQPLRVLAPDGLVMQAVKSAANQARSTSSGAAVPSVSMTGFCLEYLKPPPPPGARYQVAPEAVQQRYKPMIKILEAGRSLAEAGVFKPDSDPKAYGTFIQQWALWTRLQKWDLDQFAREFIDRTRKNVQTMKREWTGQMESALKAAAPNRFADITAVLLESEALARSQSAAR